jgi:lysophospholipase L1-like esterase
MTNIIFIGDSLTEYFDWQKRFPSHKITNLGIAGEPIEGLLDRLDRIRSLIGNPDLIFIMTGINNIAMEQYDIAGDYKEIVSKLSSWFKTTKIVVQSVLPVRLEWINNNVIKDINRHLKQIAGEFSAEYLDVYGLFVDSQGIPKRENLLDDGVHLSEEGYRVWADTVDTFLKAMEGKQNRRTT